MADIELDDARDRGDRAHRVVGQAMTRVALQSECLGAGSGIDETSKFPRARRALGLAISPGMQLDDRRADVARSLQLPCLGVDEPARPGTRPGPLR